METVTLSLPSAGKAGRSAVIDVVRWLLARPDLHLTDLFVREDQCLFGSTVDGLVRFTLSVDGVEYAPDRHQMEQFLSAVFDDGWQNRIRVRALDEGLRLDEAGWCRFNGHRFDGGRLQVAIRRHPPQPLTLEAIQAPPQFRTLAQRPRGLILFVGRTSAGKSTTMAAMLQHINLNAAAHIVRIEDPLEIPIPPERSLITERQVGSDVASADLAVHDALRQRPDVIAVSEVRDTATAGALYEAIDSGHLVLASLHAPTPVDGLARFVSYFNEDAPQRAQVLSQVLAGVIGQVRLPRLDRRGYRAFFELLANDAQQVAPLIAERRWADLKSALNEGRLEQSFNLSEQLLQGVLDKQIDHRLALPAAFDGNGFLRRLREVSRGAARPQLAGQAGASTGGHG